MYRVGLLVHIDLGLKKGAFFFWWRWKNSDILHDFTWRIEVRFLQFSNKKKTHLNSSPKIQKGASFWPFWKKSSSEKIFQYLSTCRFGQLFFQNCQKNAPFWILGDELRCVLKKGTFFFDDGEKIVIFSTILGDELRCVFYN